MSIKNNKETTRKAHDSIAKQYYEFYKDDTTDLKYFDLFLKKCGSKILALGCGMGHYSNYMEEKGFKVTGIDFSNEMIRIAQHNYKDIEFIVSDICCFQEKIKEKYNGVVLAYVLQHLSKEEVKDLMKKINENIEEKASLLFFLREGDGLVEEIEPLNNKYKYILNEYSRNEISKLLKQFGWHITFIETKEYVEDPNSLAPSTLVVIATK